MNKHYLALEYDKVLLRLQKFAGSREGKELVLELVPETNIFLAKASVERTADAHLLMAKFGAPSFSGIKNVNGPLARANAGGVLTMSELLSIASVLKSIRHISEWRSSSSGMVTKLDTLFDHLYPNKYFEEKINGAIISEDEMSDNASPRLNDIRRKMRVAASKIRDRLDRMVRSAYFRKFLREPIVTMRNGRYVVPVKVEHRGEIKGLVHDTSSSGSTVFIEPATVVEANNSIKVLQSRERDEINRILAELSARAGSYYETIKLSCECAVELDIIFAKARYGYDIKAAIPNLNDKGHINLIKARHPLIPKDKVVPTSISLGIDFDSLIITGPNTGGKTVSIKTLGLLTLMAMTGMMIPASEQSTVCVFENIFADIGDEQSIEQSLSTFSSHMTNIISIGNANLENSLVLIDELGAGTDPIEGAALAMAILEDFHQKGAKIAATTHYAELKAYAIETPRVENGSCEFDVRSLRPTYRLLIGVPGRSNAFAISSRLGISESIIERAKSLVSREDTGFENTVLKLEQSRKEFEEKTAAADELMAKAEAEIKKANEIKESIDRLKERELQKARAEATKIIDRAKRTSGALIFELEKLKKESENLGANELLKKAKGLQKKSATKFVEITNPILQTVEDENYVLPRPLVVGDLVLCTELGETAEVIALKDKKGRVEIAAGFLKMKVDESKLRLVSKNRAKQISKTPKRKEHVFVPADSGNGEIDIRGMTVDEGIMAVDLQIDTCMRLNLGSLYIIHGKGTGALRDGIRNFLRKHKYVKSFRLGKIGEGDSGVTVAEIKL